MASSSGRAAAAPIIRLYRQVLRVHRDKLPEGVMRSLGDGYATSEFRAHLSNSKTTKPQWKEFTRQWSDYVALLRGRGDDKASPVGNSGELAPDVFEALNAEQRRRMEQLKEEARRIGKEELEDAGPGSKHG